MEELGPEPELWGGAVGERLPLCEIKIRGNEQAEHHRSWQVVST
jgi:hypothetical protein